METLLSVDNALVLAAMVSHLAPDKQKRALRLGMAGAYVQRALALVFASLLINHAWIRLAGAGYLLYLMCKNIGRNAGKKPDDNPSASSFWRTVIALQFADLSFSIDNIVAAVAISSQMWVVLIGVFLGMLGMLLLSGVFASLMRKLPALEVASYLLVGTIGAELIAQDWLNLTTSPAVKLAVILVVLGVTLVYFRLPRLQKILSPVTTISTRIMALLAATVDLAAAPFLFAIGLLFDALRRLKR
jgi:tellurite resistance protein TerC